MAKYDPEIWKQINKSKIKGIDGKLNLQDSYFVMKVLNGMLKGEDKNNNHEYVRYVRNKISFAIDVTAVDELAKRGIKAVVNEKSPNVETVPKE